METLLATSNLASAQIVAHDDCERTSHAAKLGIAVGHRHRLYLHALCLMLEDVKDIQIVGKPETEQQLLDCVRITRPAIVVCEPFVSGFEGLDILEHIRALSASTRVLLILHTIDLPFIAAAIRRGAWGYLSVSASFHECEQSIHAIGRGEPWLERRLVHRLLLEGAVHAADSTRATAGGTMRLSQREQEIVRLVVLGLCNKKIATKLRIAENTVKAHLVNVFRKLGIHDRTQLAARVREANAPDASNRATAPSD